MTRKSEGRRKRLHECFFQYVSFCKSPTFLSKDSPSGRSPGGFLTSGQMMTGLLVGAGVGVLVLIRTNKHQAENLRVIAALYGSGVAWGLLIDLLGITF